MHKLTLTYSSLMPPWITDTFFNPEFERYRVTAHEYCHHESVQTMRQMDNVHLVNFFPLTLKSKNDFDAAFDLVLRTKLSEYLKLFLIPQPGDWLLSSTPDKSFTKPFRNFAAHLMSLIILWSARYRSFICKSLLFWTYTTTNER